MRKPKPTAPPEDSIGGGAVFAGVKTNSPIDRIITPSGTMLEGAKDALKSDLDGSKASALHTKLMGHYMRELDSQSVARREMETDEAYYDGDQWTDLERSVITSRGQTPMTFNVISQSINWVLGTERRGRTDYKILPRKKVGASGAERKTQILKYLSDVNQTEFHVSRAFADAVKVGVGWLESGVQSDTDGEPIYERYESWRNILFDSAATELDLSDGRYQFRTRWADLDAAISRFPKRETTLRLAAHGTHDWGSTLDATGDDAMDSLEEAMDANEYSPFDGFGATRDRLRLIEAWFKLPVREKIMSGGQFTGEIYDEFSLGHHDALYMGESALVERTTFRMYVAIMTTNGLLHLSPSPYRHNRFPFTPIWGYRKSSDGTPYGIIRAMRDAQKDINKRFSKAQHILNSQKVIMDEGAVDDIDELQEELNRPDSMIIKKPGKYLEISVERELAQSHIGIMELERGMIQSLSGITDESLGRTTNASSGKAIVARQEQGSLATAPLFDNLRLARQYHGEKTLALTEQFMTETREFRITNRRGNSEHIIINDDDPQNDIVRTKADFVISEDDWNATYREAQVQQLLEVIAQLAPVAPDVVMVLLDLVVEAMDIPSREEIVKRIRQITGQEDPDADPNAPDPERQARDAAKQAQAEMEARIAEANVRKLEGEADEKQARAAKANADTEAVMRSLAGKTIEDQRKALELAIAMLTAEPAVDTADVLYTAAANSAPTATPPMAGAPMPAGQPGMQQPPMPPMAPGNPV